MITVELGELLKYLDTLDPETPVILRDPSVYSDEEIAELPDYVSIETAMYECGAEAR